MAEHDSNIDLDHQLAAEHIITSAVLAGEHGVELVFAWDNHNSEARTKLIQKGINRLEARGFTGDYRFIGRAGAYFVNESGVTVNEIKYNLDKYFLESNGISPIGLID